MKRLGMFFVPAVVAGVLALAADPPASHADGILDFLHPANHKYKQQEPYKPNFGHHNSPPVTMVQMANVIDIIEHDLREDGTVVIQKPSVWGQARMTTYRKAFDSEMANGMSQFQFILSARIARSDQATFQSQTALAASLSPGGKSGTASAPAPFTPISVSDLSTALANLAKNDPVQSTKAFDLLSNVFKTIGVQNGQLGLEPTIFLDEKKRYIDHLNELRRINMGDDSADSAGYGLYLVRMPVSIEPGQKTDQGHGALLTVTTEHEFRPLFLQRTFRNLVINDLVDQLTPIIFEILEHNLDAGVLEKLATAERQRAQAQQEHTRAEAQIAQAEYKKQEINRTLEDIERAHSAQIKSIVDAAKKLTPNAMPPDPRVVEKLKALTVLPSLSPLKDHEIKALSKLKGIRKVTEQIHEKTPQLDTFSSQLFRAQVQLSTARTDRNEAEKAFTAAAAEIRTVSRAARIALAAAPPPRLGAVPATIVNGKTYPIAPSDKLRVFALNQASDPTALTCFLRFLATVRSAQDTVRSRATDVRRFVQHELEAAYDIMERGIEGGTIPLLNAVVLTQIVKDFHNRDFEEGQRIGASSLEGDFAKLINETNARLASHSMGFLCWAIAVDAALLNERLQEDIERISGHGRFHCTSAIKGLLFYLPPVAADTEPGLRAAEVFQEYVRTRWPLIAFSLDPVVDQQNIADAWSLRRDLQLAVAFAFSTGQIGFSQLMSFHRQIAIDAETIALNRTVTCFSHGNDTFGWRFTPRYQNPPPETNARVLASLLVRSGQNPKYQINKSKLERGQRELTAVIVMPSFLNTIRVNVRGNYFKLTHPENLTISSGRMLEQGRVVKEALETTAAAVPDLGQYRHEDVRGLRVKLEQIEKMLPMQIHDVFVPYENTLGGFDLFVPGTTALVPILAGYDGVDQVTPCPNPTDAACSQSCFFLYGKHLSILETKVVAGGRYLPDSDVEILSREVMRVKIPKDVQTTDIQGKNGKRPFVEVQLATPNGVSNRILIPLAIALPKSALMELQTKYATVQVVGDPKTPKTLTVSAVSPGDVTLKWTAGVPATDATLRLALALDKNQSFVVKAKIDSTANSVKIDVNDLRAGLQGLYAAGLSTSVPSSFNISVESVLPAVDPAFIKSVADPMTVAVFLCAK